MTDFIKRTELHLFTVVVNKCWYLQWNLEIYCIDSSLIPMSEYQSM